MLPKSPLLALVALLALGNTAAHAQNLLEDGSFDAATSGGQTSNSAWSLIAEFAGTIPGSSAQFQENFGGNDIADPRNGVWFKAFVDDEGGSVNATLSQWLVAGAGGSYSLTFDAKREAHFAAGSWIVSLSSSGTGGTDWIDLLAAAPADGTWNMFSLSLAGVSAGDILTVSAEMVDGVRAAINPQSAFVDNFDLEARSVPEPESVGLAALALLALLGVRRRRGRGTASDASARHCRPES